MKVLRASTHKSMPWKNGGGQTTEIAVFPEDADLSEFDWRISMAQVASDGPFSSFPGIERTLCILEGSGLLLTLADREPLLLDTATAPFTFAADVKTSATLPGGPVVDFNVMTRRGPVTHSVYKRQTVTRDTIYLSGDQTLIFIHRGNMAVRAGETRELLGPLDAVLLLDKKPLVVEASAPVEWYLVEFHYTKSG